MLSLKIKPPIFYSLIVTLSFLLSCGSEDEPSSMLEEFETPTGGSWEFTIDGTAYQGVFTYDPISDVNNLSNQSGFSALGSFYIVFDPDRGNTTHVRVTQTGEFNEQRSEVSVGIILENLSYPTNLPFQITSFTNPSNRSQQISAAFEVDFWPNGVNKTLFLGNINTFDEGTPFNLNIIQLEGQPNTDASDGGFVANYLKKVQLTYSGNFGILRSYDENGNTIEETDNNIPFSIAITFDYDEIYPPIE